MHNLFLLLLVCTGYAQTVELKGKVIDAETKLPVKGARVYCEKESPVSYTDVNGYFSIRFSDANDEPCHVFAQGYEKLIVPHEKWADSLTVIELKPLSRELREMIVKAKNENAFSITRLNPVEGTAIYAGKKSEVVLLDKTDANLASNNSRQVYAKVAGLTIWESDGAGLQLGIGARGLSPNRTSNFNTRQNGYDISADALGYPESYYTPSAEALERIEVVRGASSLQYGTQFGGIVNFVMKKGNPLKPIEVVSRNTLGSYGFFNTYNSIGGTYKRWNYIASYQHKQGKGWRENSGFGQDNVFTNIVFNASEKLSFSADYTHMRYLSQQPGGLTDVMFEQDPKQSIRNRNWFSVNWNLFAFSVNYAVNNKMQLNSRTFGLLANRKSVGFIGNISRTDPLTERDLIIGEFANTGNETRLLSRYSIKNNPAILLTGIRVYKGRTRSRQGLTNTDSTAYFEFTNPHNLEGSDNYFPGINAAVFAENIFYFGKKLSVTPGARLEYIRTSSSGYYKQKETDLAGNVLLEQNVETQTSRERFVPLAGLGISYKPFASAEMYGNLSQNYRAINFSDLQIVNTNYKVDSLIADEYGYTADAGIRGVVKNWLTYDVSAFYIRYKNRIGEVLKTDPSTLSVYRYRTNIADSYSAGLEFFTEVNICKAISDSCRFDLSVFTNLSWVNAFYTHSDETAIQGKQVELVPPVTLRTGISFRSKRFSCTWQYSFTAQQFTDATNAIYTANAVSGIVSAYNVMDISAGYSYKYFRLETGINNLTNNLYFTRRATSYPGPGIMPADGRTVYVSLQIRI